MTELELLAKRRELVVLAAQLQRATMLKRFDRIEANPARRMLGIVATVVKRPAMLSLGTAAIRFAFRAYRRRSARLKH